MLTKASQLRSKSHDPRRSRTSTLEQYAASPRDRRTKGIRVRYGLRPVCKVQRAEERY